MTRFSFSLTEVQIRQNVTDRMFLRGREYFDDRRIVFVFCRDGVLYAAVTGSADAPYRVVVRVFASGAVAADCDCPYEYEGWCKHIVAVLLCAWETPCAIEERPSVAALVAALGADEAKRILAELAWSTPDIADLIETRLKTMRRRVSSQKIA